MRSPFQLRQSQIRVGVALGVSEKIFLSTVIDSEPKKYERLGYFSHSCENREDAAERARSSVLESKSDIS